MADSKRSHSDSRKRYKHRIPLREDIIKIIKAVDKPMALAVVSARFNLKNKQQQKALQTRLRAMVRDGQLLRNRANEYCLTHHLDLVVGKVKAHRDGFGFLVTDDEADDVYISSREMASLWDGDRVAMRVSETTRGREGFVVDIINRNTKYIAGRLMRERGIDLVFAERGNRSSVLIPRGQKGGAKTGDIVQVEIVEHPTQHKDAIGRVIHIAGRFDDPGMPTTTAILSHGLPFEWSQEIDDHVGALSRHVPASSKRGREDLRKVPLVTIDGSDAKDFDDAVYCEREGDGWRLIVAIADVSHYVKPDSSLDKEARARGTSVYFPGQVIPMLPEPLSNGLCSLKPNVDRLCLCCDMNVSKKGAVTQSRFYKGVLSSAARFTYEEAAQILDNKKLQSKKQKLKPQIVMLNEVYQALAKKRRARGAIDFDVPESAIFLDERGQVKDVQPIQRLITHKIIEECMIAANVEAAKYLHKRRIPSLYRVHAGPDSDRMEELVLFLQSLGHKVSSSKKIEVSDLSEIIKNVSGLESELIESVILRAMSRAIYQSKNIGHFGLALPMYAHFTSPIRRYPDLLVHRAIKHLLCHGDSKRFYYSLSEMNQLGEHCSRLERRADEAVWEVEERLKCVLLKERIGEEFEVVITSIMPFGFFARIPKFQIDGLVHMSSLPGRYYRREEGGLSLVGEGDKNRYRLNDRLKVKLTNVVVEEGKIDFMPIG